MAGTKTILKWIDGSLYEYSQDADIIRNIGLDNGREMVAHEYDRTLVDRPVDLCLEITRTCNYTCLNCFSNSVAGEESAHMKSAQVMAIIEERRAKTIRVCLTGGEPLLHPEIESILKYAAKHNDLGFVLSTNGTIDRGLDALIADSSALVAVSVHGRRELHNSYTGARGFDRALKRIEKLSRTNTVHIYCVLSDGMTKEDIEWLASFRQSSGATYLRFIEPRPFGRYRLLKDGELRRAVQVLAREGHRIGYKSRSSLTTFVSCDGEIRLSS